MRNAKSIARVVVAGVLLSCAPAYDYYDAYPYYYDAYMWDDAYYYSGVYGYYPVYTVRDSASAAQTAATRAPSLFTPEGCAMAVADGNKMTLTLSACTGPHGLKTVSGTITLEFDVASDTQGRLKISSDSLTGNGGYRITLDSSAEYVVTGNTVTLTPKSQTRVTAPNGTELKRHTNEATMTITQGSNCITHDSSEDVTIAGKTWEASVSGYRRCLGQCPTGVFTLKSPGGNSVTFTFDGTSTAVLSRERGGPATATIVCD